MICLSIDWKIGAYMLTLPSRLEKTHALSSGVVCNHDERPSDAKRASALTLSWRIFRLPQQQIDDAYHLERGTRRKNGAVKKPYVQAFPLSFGDNGDDNVPAAAAAC